MSEEQAPERFGHTPFVCGYLGPDTAGHWESLLSAAPVPVKERSRARLHAFAASKAPGLERIRGRRAWVWGRHLVTDRAPADWRDAAQDLGLAGFWVGGGELRLHTDAWGVPEVYVRELDGTTYFANRVDPLVRIGSARLHTDWEAWADQMTLNGVMHDRTGFVEVRRLAFAESRCWVDGRPRRTRDLPAWMAVDRVDGTIDEAVAALVAQMPSDADEESAIGLSGGWDSRMIAVLTKHAGLRPPSAWTAHHDLVVDEDPDLAPAVAEALDMPHEHVTFRGARHWQRRREPFLRRVEHETVLHMWMDPVAARMRGLGVPVWDGLLGDVLFRAAGASTDITWAGPIAAQREAQWLRQGETFRSEFLAIRRDVTRQLHEASRANWYADTDVFTGLPSELTMRVATSKSARILAAGPTRLVAPEARLRLPFLTPEVVAAATAVPAVRRTEANWAFYRSMIARLDPVVAALPSSNDPDCVPTASPPSCQLHPRSVARCAEQIVADETVLALFTPEAQGELRQGRALDGTSVRMEALQWGQALASWRARYGDRLVDERL